MTNKKTYVYLLLIILLQLGLLFFYMTQKVGFHIDELWSYAISTSINTPLVYSKDFKYDQQYLFNKWISGEFFKNQLSIQKEERFDYLKVKQNISKDIHPPFYQYLIHTICSFFPDSFSKWYGFGLNIFLFVLIQIILFFICKKLFSEKLALFILLYYGLTSASINTFINIRMYALLTFFFLLISLIYIKAFESKNLKLTFLSVFVTAFLGSYTQYHFIVYVFYLTAVFGIICLFQKKYKNLFCVSVGAILGVSLVYLLFPAIVNHLIASPRADEAANQFSLINIFFFWQKDFFSIILCHLFGFNLTTAKVLCVPFNIVFLMVYCFVLISLIFGKYVSLNNFKILQLFSKTSGFITDSFNKNYQLFSILVAVYLFVSTIAQTINYGLMNVHSVRYFSPVYPFLAIIIVLMVFKLKEYIKFRHKNLMIIFLLLLSTICGQVFNLVYLFPEKDYEFVEAFRTKYADILINSNVIVKALDTDKIFELSFLLKNSNKCFFYKESNELLNILKTINFDEKNYLIVPYVFSSHFSKNPYLKKGVKFKHIAFIANMLVYDLFEIQKAD